MYDHTIDVIIFDHISNTLFHNIFSQLLPYLTTCDHNVIKCVNNVTICDHNLTKCDLIIIIIFSLRCQNGAKCNNSPSDAIGYRCNCPNDFAGVNCDIKVR